MVIFYVSWKRDKNQFQVLLKKMILNSFFSVTEKKTFKKLLKNAK